MSLDYIVWRNRMKYITKDSGKRKEYKSGMVRDLQDDKPRYDLIYEPFLTDFAELLSRGAKKYGENNWMLADSVEELKRFKASAWRHFIQFMRGDTDEAHHSAIAFNIAAIQMMMDKLGCDIDGNKKDNKIKVLLK